MIATVLALLISALGVALLLGTTLHSGGDSPAGNASGPGVALADRVQAQQSLSTGLATAQSTAASAGGFSGVNASSLQAANPSITFVDGPSSSPTTVSVAVSASGGSATGGDGGTGASGSSTGDGGGVPSIPGLSGGANAGGGGGGGASDGGSITLADRSSDGVCWLVWTSTGSTTWYGAQTGSASCSAPQVSSPPTPGPVSASAIGWQQGGFPSP